MDIPEVQTTCINALMIETVSTSKTSVNFSVTLTSFRPYGHKPDLHGHVISHSTLKLFAKYSAQIMRFHLFLTTKEDIRKSSWRDGSWNLFWLSWTESTKTHPCFLKTILILSSHLLLYLPCGPFFSVLTTRTLRLTVSDLLHTCPMQVILYYLLPRIRFRAYSPLFPFFHLAVVFHSVFLYFKKPTAIAKSFLFHPP
jgi:hypothetical protein